MSAPSPSEVQDLAEAIQVFELVEVVAYEHSGKRVPVAPEDVGGTTAESELEVMVRNTAGEIETRFRMTVTAPGMELASDVGVIYKSEDYVLTQRLLPAFLEEIGIMAAYPYLREGTSTSAVRLGLPAPTLGLLRRGQFTLRGAEDPDSSPAVESAESERD